MTQKVHLLGGKWRWIIPAAVLAGPAAFYLAYRVRPRDPERTPKQARPWQVKAYSTLPLKAMSRAWGRVNNIELPLWMRAHAFKFYSWLFNVNLDEIADKDLTHYKNLSDFFYRRLVDGARPIGKAPLVSPSDGTILQFGRIVDNRIEQVKGVSYSLEAFLGAPDEAPHRHTSPPPEVDTEFFEYQEDDIERHHEFAQLNGISYTIDKMVGKAGDATTQQGDVSTKEDSASTVSAVVRDMWLPKRTTENEEENLFYAVIYLSPGNYHRFHSPASWVVQLRRHYVGELFSVAPYFQNRLTNLFCLNERVALLGRWRYGFFSMTPVGATNVGSIRINFDRYLRTNTKYVEEADTKIKARKSECFEATYASASPVLQGHPLTPGQEMGGFRLGSTIVLIFEAPKNLHFLVQKGDKVQVGQPLADLSVT